MRHRLILSSVIVALCWSAEVIAATRVITGTLYRPNDTVWAGGALTIQLLETFSNIGQTVVPQTWRATATAAGVVTVSILVPDVGAARYLFTLPDGTAVEVTLGVGATVLLETIFTTSLSDPVASTTLADLIASLAVALAPATSARNVVQPSADVVPFTVSARVAGQTANLTEWKNTAGTVVASLSPEGVLLAGTPYVSKSAVYTLTLTDGFVACNATTAGFSLTLPTASTATGREYTMKKIDATGNACTLVGTIDGVTNLSTTTQWASYTVISNGTSWYIK